MEFFLAFSAFCTLMGWLSYIYLNYRLERKEQMLREAKQTHEMVYAQELMQIDREKREHEAFMAKATLEARKLGAGKF